MSVPGTTTEELRGGSVALGEAQPGLAGPSIAGAGRCRSRRAVPWRGGGGGGARPSPAQPRAAPAALRGRCWRRSAAGAMRRRRRAAALLELSAGERGGMGTGMGWGWEGMGWGWEGMGFSLSILKFGEGRGER